MVRWFVEVGVNTLLVNWFVEVGANTLLLPFQDLHPLSSVFLYMYGRV